MAHASRLAAFSAIVSFACACDPDSTSGFTTGGTDVADVSGDTATPPSTDGDPTRRLLELLRAEGAFIPLTQRQRLESELDRAGGAWKNGDNCAMASAFEAFLKQLQGVTENPPTLVTRLSVLARRESFAAARRARELGKPCAGFETVDAPTGTKPFAPTNTSAKVEITFPQAGLQLVWSPRDKRHFAALDIPGVEGVGAVLGRPDIPFLRKLVIIPDGATARLTASNLRNREKLRLDLVPLRPENPVVPEAPPFALVSWAYNQERYGVSGTYPETPCTLEEAGSFRGVRLAFITCFAGQMDLATRVVTLFSSVEASVTLSGVKGWVPSIVDSGFEDLSLVRHHAINGPMLEVGDRIGWHWAPNLVDLSHRGPCTLEADDAGETLLIFAADAFRAQAERLASLRNAEGMPARVVTVLAGETVRDLDRIVESRFHTCPIRPSFVLLFGDSDSIPTATYLRAYQAPDPYFDYENGTLAGDFELAHIGPIDAFPDLAVGRLPVRTEADAKRVVDLLVRWQGAPVTAGRAYLRSFAFGGAFECCASGEDIPEGQEAHVFTSQIRRAVMAARAAEYNVEVHMSRTGAVTTPAFDDRGRPLYAPLRPEDRYPWAAKKDDIAGVFRRGTGLFVYSNHGGPDAWSEPGRITSQDISNYRNTEVFSPFVVNFTCLANLFDNEQNPGTWGVRSERRLLGETLALGGTALTPAVGVVGTTRISFGGPNSHLVDAVVDAFQPTTLPDFGPPGKLERTGTAGVFAMWRLSHIYRESSTPPGDWGAPISGYYWQTMAMFAHLGDPTAPIVRQDFSWLAGRDLAPVGEPELAPVQFSDAAWDVMPEPSGPNLPLLPAGPADVNPADYTFDTTHPVIVDWLSGGLTVLGGAEGSFVTAHQTRRYGNVRDRRFLGRAQILGGRADLHFLPLPNVWPVATSVVLTTPVLQNFTLRDDGTSDFPRPVNGIGAFPAENLHRFDGVATGPVAQVAAGGPWILTGTGSTQLNVVADNWGWDGPFVNSNAALDRSPELSFTAGSESRMIGFRLRPTPQNFQDTTRQVVIVFSVEHNGVVDRLRWPITVGVATQVGISSDYPINVVRVSIDAPVSGSSNGLSLDDVRWK